MYEKEKIKIRLSNLDYIDLEKDMSSMNFYKPNGSLNKNKFFIKLIKGMYQDYLITNANIEKALSIEFENDKNSLSKIANNINQLNFISRYSDRNLLYYDKNIYIQITKESRSMFNEIEYSLIGNITLSEFIRCLIHQYICMAHYERERCILFDLYCTLKEIKDNQKECMINTKDGKQYKFQIGHIYIDDDEKHRIISGFALSNNKKELMYLKLADIDYITSLKSSYSFTKEEKELIFNYHNL